MIYRVVIKSSHGPSVFRVFITFIENYPICSEEKLIFVLKELSSLKVLSFANVNVMVVIVSA